MDEELIAADLVQTARVLVTVSGQVGERLARAQAERLRQQQNAAAEEQREFLGQQRQRETAQARAERQAVDAGRLVYGRVRTLNWSADDAQRRVGEAMVAASTMASRDQVAADAQRYLIAETKARFGPEADSWLTTAILRWRELENERTDQASAEAAAERTPAETRASAAANEPTFSVTEFRNEAEYYRDISKTEALTTIDLAAEPPANGRGDLSDLRRWVGRDPDVDRAIASKLPELLTEEQRVRITDEQQRRPAEAAEPWSAWREESAEVESGRADKLEAEADRQRQLVDDIIADDRRDQDTVAEDLVRADDDVVSTKGRPELQLPPATTEQERAIDQVVAGTRAGYPRDAAEDHAHTATTKPARMRRSRGAARDHSRSPGR